MANLIKSSGIMRSVAILIFRIFPRGVHDKNNISFVLNQDHLMFFSFVPISFFFFHFCSFINCWFGVCNLLSCPCLKWFLRTIQNSELNHVFSIDLLNHKTVNISSICIYWRKGNCSNIPGR